MISPQSTNNQYTNIRDRIYRSVSAVISLLALTMALHAKTLTIASWNVENLFDMQYDGTEYAEYIPGRHGWSEAMLRKKLRNISKVICDLDADVIGLQEVENDRVLARLQKRLERAGCAYRYREITGDTRTPVHNALLSRIRLKKIRDLRISRYGRERSILEADLDTDPPLRLFVNHWRSKRGPESERVVYARALKRRLEKLPAGAEYLLLGDFNSNYNESISIDKKHNDTHNVTGIDTILHTMEQGRMVRLSSLKAGEHYSLWMELAAGARWSHNFFGDKEAIDAMLIPPSLHDGRGWEYQVGSFRVYRPKYLFGRHGAINRWAYRHGKHLGKGYSDHLPIMAVFDSDGQKSVGYKTLSWFKKGLMWLGIGKNREQGAGSREQKNKNVQASLFSGQPQGITPMPPTNARHTNIPITNDQYTNNKYTTISQIKKLKKISQPVLLKNVHVIFKRNESAVIQQSKDGEAILLYRSARQLEEGHCYDLKVYRMKHYKGLPELTDVEVERAPGRCETAPFILDFRPDMLRDPHAIGRVVRRIEGVIQRHRIIVDGLPCRIHFRRQAGRPHEGSRIVIDHAQIGYYKDHAELVVWSKKDYR